MLVGYIFFQALKEELNLDRWKLGNKYFRAGKRTDLSLEVEMSIRNIDDVFNSYFTIYLKFVSKIFSHIHYLFSDIRIQWSPLFKVLLSTILVTCCQPWSENIKWKISK